MLLTFYVHGRGKDEPEPLSWAKDAYEYVLETAKEAGRYAGLVEDDPAGDLRSAVVEKVEQVGKAGQDAGEGGSGAGWFGTVFGGLSTLRTSVTGQGVQKGLPPPGTYKVGEVHGDYVKVSYMRP
jgi:import inner membrane translocase subunit TIM21